jgi:hypothetical protein
MLNRTTVVLMAVAGGIAVGYVWPGSASERQAPPAAPRIEADPASEARVNASTPARALSTPPAATPQPGGNAEQTVLQQRALAGDGSAALQWLDLDRTCSHVMRAGPIDFAEYFDEESPPPDRPPFTQMTADEHAQLRDNTIDAARRQTLARAIGARLHASCDGYRASSDAERYAIAQIAAQHGPPEGLRRFITEPPFYPDLVMNQGGDAEQLARIRDWSQRVPAMLRERAGRGDADAALALGVAYAMNAGDAPPGLEAYALLNGALDNDAVQSYRWLSRYLQFAPDGAHATFARAALTRLVARLDAPQRAALERELQTAIAPPRAD